VLQARRLLVAVQARRASAARASRAALEQALVHWEGGARRDLVAEREVVAARLARADAAIEGALGRVNAAVLARGGPRA
jgi:hypothetical protein